MHMVQKLTLVSNVDFSFKVFSGRKVKPFGPVFSTWISVSNNFHKQSFPKTERGSRWFFY